MKTLRIVIIGLEMALALLIIVPGVWAWRRKRNARGR